MILDPMDKIGSMNKKQKEGLVLALYEKGKTYREITKEAGVSPNTIKAIVNKAGLDQNTSITSRVYELYSQQNSPLQVAIALGLKAEEALRYHQEFFMLLGCTEFTKLYLRIKDNPWPYVNLVELALDSGTGDDEVLELLKIANDSLPSVRVEYDKLEVKRSSLEANVTQLARTLQEINDHILKESKTLEQIRFIYNQLKEETENLNTKKARLENVIDSFQSDNEMNVKIIEIIKQEIKNIILNPRRLLQFALLSIFESSRKHPGKLHAMYYNMPTIRIMGNSLSETPIGDSYHPVNGYEQYLSEYINEYGTSEKLLLDEAEQLYNRLIEESMNMYTRSEMTDNTVSSPKPLQPFMELPDVQHQHQHQQARKEDHYSISDAEYNLFTVKVECNNPPVLQVT
jgi:predicted transcriptional regulator